MIVCPFVFCAGSDGFYEQTRWRWSGGISGATGVGAAPSHGTAPGTGCLCSAGAGRLDSSPGSRRSRRPRGHRRHPTLRPPSLGGPASGAPTSAHVRAEPLALPPPRVPLSRRSCSPRPALGSRSRRPSPARLPTPLRSPTAAQREDGGVQIPPAAPRPPHPPPGRTQG